MSYVSIYPLTRLEDEVFNRLLEYIPAGEFYNKAQYTLPNFGGNQVVPFVISGIAGRVFSVYLNDKLITRIGLVASQETVNLTLRPPPEVNYLKVKDEYNNDVASTSVMLANYSSVHYGAVRDYFSHIWLQYLYNKWSLTTPWSGRLIEYLFKYHDVFPDTQAMRVLADRLTSRATWQDSPSTLGIESLLGSLTCGIPVTIPVTCAPPNNFDLARYPLMSAQGYYAGHWVNVWAPDLAYAKEHAFLHLCRNFPALYEIKGFREGILQLNYNSDYVELRKDPANYNLRALFAQIGSMDYWQSFLSCKLTVEIGFSAYNSHFDNVVTEDLSGGNPFDSRDAMDHTTPFDSGDQWAYLWKGKSVRPLDSSGYFDSHVNVAVSFEDLPNEGPYGSLWDYEMLEASATTAEVVTNTLHGGIIPEYVHGL